MDDQPADRLLGVAHREQLAATAQFAQDALVADLAATLGVEGRPVEDDLGLAVAGQLVELDAVADDRDDATLGRGRLVAEEARVAGAPLDRAVQRGLLGLARELGLRARPAPLALLGEGALEAVAVDANAVLRRELDRQVDREAVRVVEAEGDLAGQHGRVGREVLGTAPDDALRAGQPGERLLEDLRARVERARELGLLAGDRGQDLVALGSRCG